MRSGGDNTPHGVMSSIADVQDQKEAEILPKYANAAQPEHKNEVKRSETEAARILQRTYRGHRERRQLQGLSLDPTTRWTEVSKQSWTFHHMRLSQAFPPSVADGFARQSKKLNTRNSPPLVPLRPILPTMASTGLHQKHVRLGLESARSLDEQAVMKNHPFPLVPTMIPPLPRKKKLENGSAWQRSKNGPNQPR